MMEAIFVLLFLGLCAGLWVAVLKRMGRGRDYKRFGYVDMPFRPPERKLFGSVEYSVTKKGRGLSGLAVSNNPYYYRREDKLKEIEDEQSGEPCEVCGDAVERYDREKAYEETWRADFFLGIMTNFEYVDAKVYCNEHTNSEISFNVSVSKQ